MPKTMELYTLNESMVYELYLNKAVKYLKQGKQEIKEEEKKERKAGRKEGWKEGSKDGLSPEDIMELLCQPQLSYHQIFFLREKNKFHLV